MKDSYGREIDYLRISVTGRCNLRCGYCMPRGETEEPAGDILGSDEIVLAAGAAARTGIKYIRLTGGEPLLREDICDLVKRICAIDKIETVSMTTNGIFLEEYSERLAAAGLSGVNVSLDTLDDGRFALITGTENRTECGVSGPRRILAGIDEAIRDGLQVKINCVLTDINRDEWADLCLLARDRNADVRFIELMPVGCAKGLKGVSNRELEAKVRERFGEPEPVFEKRGNGPAVYLKFAGFKGCIGFISAICDRFCSSCNRIRLTSAGILKPCLCYSSQTDLKRILRNGADISAVEEAIRETIMNKPAAHCFDTPELISESAGMSQIGG